MYVYELYDALRPRRPDRPSVPQREKAIRVPVLVLQTCRSIAPYDLCFGPTR